MHPSLDLTGRTAIVTGAARGLGCAEARALAARGANVIATDIRNAGQANYAAAKAGVAALTVTLAAELRRYGVRVNAIAPRARTSMSAAVRRAAPRTRP